MAAVARVRDDVQPVSVTVTDAGRSYQITLSKGTTFPPDAPVVVQHAWAFEMLAPVEDASAEPGRKRSVKRATSDE